MDCQDLEQNISVDSLHLITRLYQPMRPIEVEAFVRNGSDKDATGVVVTMAFDDVRVTQRAVDIPAGDTRSIVLSSPPQKRGMLAVSIELEDDAIDGDNVRYAGVTIPPQARIAVVGKSIGAELVATALRLQGTIEEPANVTQFVDLDKSVPSSLPSMDVVFLVDGAWSPTNTLICSHNSWKGAVV